MQNLKRALLARHLAMNVHLRSDRRRIPTGSRCCHQCAGPAVLISYALGGLVTLLVVALLAEMASGMPAAGSFQFYVSLSLGGYAGFITGSTYWLAFLLGPATEAIVAGEILHSWFPAIPNWAFYLLIAAAGCGGERRGCSALRRDGVLARHDQDSGSGRLYPGRGGIVARLHRNAGRPFRH